MFVCFCLFCFVFNTGNMFICMTNTLFAHYKIQILHLYIYSFIYLFRGTEKG